MNHQVDSQQTGNEPEIRGLSNMFSDISYRGRDWHMTTIPNTCHSVRPSRAHNIPEVCPCPCPCQIQRLTVPKNEMTFNKSVRFGGQQNPGIPKRWKLSQERSTPCPTQKHRLYSTMLEPAGASHNLEVNLSIT